MGMFDDISVVAKLPVNQQMIDLGLDKNNRSFQTKDLECCLNKYFIQDGILFLQKYKINEWVEGDQSSKSFLDRLGHLKREEPYLENSNYHGTINFYSFDVIGNLDCTTDYKATFTHGKLDNIELIEFKTRDNTESTAKMKAMMEEQLKRSKKWYNKYIFNTKVWMAIRKFICRMLYKFEEWIADTRIHMP
jgi:hypothetical protein